MATSTAASAPEIVVAVESKPEAKAEVQGAGHNMASSSDVSNPETVAAAEATGTGHGIDPATKARIEELWKDAEILYDERGVPPTIRDLLNSAFSKIPVSTFPSPPLGHVLEIPSSASISEVVETLSKNKIMSAPVRNVDVPDDAAWSDRYLGMVDFPAVVLWVLEQAELAAAALTAGTAATAGISAGAVGALGAVALGMTGPAAVAGLTAAAVGAAVASGIASHHGPGHDAASAANVLGGDFYKMILKEEPFCSTKVGEITKTFRWAPFLPIQPDDSMLTVLLLLSKFRMRSIPVIAAGQPHVTNIITQSAVVRGLSQCHGFDWFDLIADKSIYDLGLPAMGVADLVTVNSDEPVLGAFALMREKDVGGLPVVQGKPQKTVGNISVRDVRFLLLKPDMFARRKELTVMDFMKLASAVTDPDIIAQGQPSTPLEPVTCSESESLKSVIDKLVAHSIHRVHVVKEGNELTGVVTLRDIISRFVTEPPDYFGDFFGGVVDIETVMP